MPTYGGGKAKIGQQIADVIADLRHYYNYEETDILEPFCGMLGASVHLCQLGNLSVCDYNSDIIAMWKCLKKGWVPPNSCNKQQYEQLKVSQPTKSIDKAKKGFIGVCCAYSGIYFAGYRTKTGNRDFFKQSRRSVLKITKQLPDIKILSARSYDQFEPKNMTIYCDPPYRNNKFRCPNFDCFDSDKFWETMREWSKDNLVIISEYSAPKDFIPIWSKVMKTTYNRLTEDRTEKLFIHQNFKIRTNLPQ